MQIFDIKNKYILDNMLGAYYIDQEKGWALLNRGKVIGKISFNIEHFIRGLSERSCVELEDELAEIDRQIYKYKSMFDVAQYQTEINVHKENIAYNTSLEEIEIELNILYSERKPIQSEFDRIKNVIKKNMSFVKFISDFKLTVEENNIKIPVNENTIVGFHENAEYLVTKRRLFSNQLSDIDKKISALKKKVETSNVLFDVQTKIQEFDADVSKMRVDAISTERIIRQLKKRKKELEEIINKNTRINNPVILELYQLISAYTSELGIHNRYMGPQAEYIFTDDLKSLSGAIFHKLVFSFKMSYVKLIYNHTGLRLPLVIDSPSGREVDSINIADTMKILSRDFSKHQIIIASINKYNFPDENYIVLENQLFKYEHKEM